MLRRAGVVLFVVVATLKIASAQWLNYPTPGIPRLPDGKPNLAAKAPRTRDGKPDLSGVWHVYSEPLDEKKRLFGPNVGAISVPGMEPDTISKYGVNILLDFKPGEIVMTPEAQRVMDERRKDNEDLTTLAVPADGHAARDAGVRSAEDRSDAGTDSDRARARRHATSDLHRRPQAAREPQPDLARIVSRPMGR